TSELTKVILAHDTGTIHGRVVARSNTGFFVVIFAGDGYASYYSPRLPRRHDRHRVFPVCRETCVRYRGCSSECAKLLDLNPHRVWLGGGQNLQGRTIQAWILPECFAFDGG